MREQADYGPLLKPVKIGQVTLKNSMGMASMGTNSQDPDGLMNDQHVAYYGARAKGGFGLIILEGQNISHTVDPVMYAQDKNDTEYQMQRWSRVIDVLHAHGAAVCVQLCAGQGRVAAITEPGAIPTSASPVPALADPSTTCRELGKREIAEIVAAFGRCAKRAVRAGADMIEVNAHLGYLIDQFMTPLWNHREDEYGGPFENRMRIVRESYESIRRAVGPRVPIGFRLSMEHELPGGRTMEQSQRICRYLEGLGFDFLDINTSSEDNPVHMVPPVYDGDSCNRRAAEAAKAAVLIPILHAGAHTPASAARMLGSGLVDVALFGRQSIADPDMPSKIEAGKAADVRPCLACNQGCLGMLYSNLPITCAVNAQANRERDFPIARTAHPKKVAVIGGGTAGMEAARVAALEGHKVVLYEKADALGGQFLAAAAPVMKGRLRSYLAWQERQLDKLGVEVRLRSEVGSEGTTVEDSDEVIVAVGGSPKKLPIPGINLPSVIDAVSAHQAIDRMPGDEVVIAGGGLNGCELAVDLARRGKHVTVVEMLDCLAKAERIAQNRIPLMAALEEAGVTQYVNTKVVEFRQGSVIAQRGEEMLELPADIAIYAYGTVPNTEAVKHLVKMFPNARVIGDCQRTGQVMQAVHDGFFAAWSIG